MISAAALSAQDMVAGWDFSQYAGSGIGSTDGATFTETLSANYSDFDPTFGAGAESAAFGTLYYDGSFGSTNVNPNGSTDAIWPSSGNLSSNQTRPAGVQFGANTVQIDEGATFAGDYSLTNQADVSLVFTADLTSTSQFGQDWVFTFAGSHQDSTGTATVEFSTDGVSYSTIDTFNLTTADSLFTSNLGSDLTDVAYVRLSLSGNAASLIDNVAISGTVVPEPSTYAAIAGVLALGFAAYRRRRRA